ncbi:3113_t:CDS:1, partial [Scutellospora calospora]
KICCEDNKYLPDEEISISDNFYIEDFFNNNEDDNNDSRGYCSFSNDED